MIVAALIALMSNAGRGIPARAQGPQFAQNDLPAAGRAQIAALLAEKAALTPTQRKIDSQLLHAKRMLTGETSVMTANIELPRAASGKVQMELRADVSASLLDSLRAMQVDVVATEALGRSVLVDADLLQIEQIATLPDVYFVQPKPGYITQAVGGHHAASTDGSAIGRAARRERKALSPAVGSLRAFFGGQGAITNAGAVLSQGDITHKAAIARSTYAIDGTGVKVGVLSDSAIHVSDSQATGDLPPSVTILPGQTGTGEDEGIAMMEIIHDLAPGAQLYFATALNTPAQFATNIRNLAAAGCTVIVDDVGYFVESPFQDGQDPGVVSATNGGVVAQAVKDVTAAGVLYFSSAANSGSLDRGTSGTWEGDFVDGGAVSGPIASAGETGEVHSFGSATYDTVLAATGPISLHWSDPLGGSANDYDIFLLDSTGTTLKYFSAGVQNGSQDPFEIMNGGVAGDRIVVVRFSGAARFLHLDTNRGRLSIATAGSTHGHADTTSLTSFSVAATPAANPFTTGYPTGPYPNPFNSANVTEPFSSDGPRHIFFTSTGAAITPGNVSSSGGQVLSKPDITAADGVSVTGVGGFGSPFFGTSAAAPHAAAIAALMKSKKPSATAMQIRAALLSSVVDIHAAGVDRNSGAGIVMADKAIQSLLALGHATSDFNGDGKSDPGIFRPSVTPNALWYSVPSGGGSAFQIFFGASGDIPVVGDYDGDGKSDAVIFRASTGLWYGPRTGAASIVIQLSGLGQAGDIPVPCDYDGDGKIDPAIYRPSTGLWFGTNAAGNVVVINTNLGLVAGDIPVPADYNGDGKCDPGIMRPGVGPGGTNLWYSVPSGGGSAFQIYFGAAGDIPVPGDYDGDGKADAVIFRPSTGLWYGPRTGAAQIVTQTILGQNGDIPIQGDYDGNGAVDPAIYRPSTGLFYAVNAAGTLALMNTNLGVASGDIATPARPHNPASYPFRFSTATATTARATPNAARPASSPSAAAASGSAATSSSVGSAASRSGAADASPARSFAAGTASQADGPTLALTAAPAGGGVQTLALTASAASDAAPVDTIDVLIDSQTASASSCRIGYEPATNSIRLADASGGWTEAVPLGTAGELRAAQCTVDVGASAATIAGDEVTVTIAVTLDDAFGVPAVYGQAHDAAGRSSPWQPLGAR
ncbi:MAG TPA: S8 family serine peptidase [Vicinamibacterales bacterium]|nr:S8 family serine peptidase [Vicinamibacterales bacterium]